MSLPGRDVTHGHGHDGSVEVRMENNVAIMTMKCGENRFNNSTLAKINAALDQVERNPNAQVLVTTSLGKFFSSGLDLPFLIYWAKKDAGKFTQFLKVFHDTMMRLLTFPMPTIALINGHAAAGGAMLALVHDVRIMRRDRGFFYLSEVRIGIPLIGATGEIVRRKIPQGAAFTNAVVLGRRLTGPEMLTLGICSYICEEAELEEKALQVARNLLSQAPYKGDFLKAHKNSLYSSIINAKAEGPIPLKLFDRALTIAKM